MKKSRNMYVCPKCFGKPKECICEREPFYLQGIDKGMGEILKNLNRKGYRTKYSCESHPTEESITAVYINFFNHYSFNVPLPENKTIDRHDTITYLINRKESIENKVNYKNKILQELLEWSVKLEDTDEYKT